MKEEELFDDTQEIKNIVNRYENMRKQGEKPYFDVYEFEDIINYYIDQGSLSEAQEAVSYASEIHPKAGPISLKRVQVMIDSGNFRKAYQLLDEIEQAGQTEPDFFLLRATILAVWNRIPEAKANFNKAIKILESTEEKVEVLQGISWILHKHHFFDLAIEYLERARVLEPANFNVIYELAINYDADASYEKSVDCYRIYLDENPFAAEVWYNLGTVFSKTEQFENAIEAYDFAIAIEPELSSAYYNKGNAMANLDRHAESIAVYHEFLDLEPENSYAYSYIAESYERMSNYADAIKNFRKAVDLEPTQALAWYGLGVVYMHLGELEKSMQYFETALEYEPLEPDFWMAIAELHARNNNEEKALEAIIKATELNPYDYEAWLQYADLLFAKNSFEETIEVLKQGYEYNPSNIDINFRLTAYYMINGDKKEALMHLKKVLEINDPRFWELMDTLPLLTEDPDIQDLLKKYRKEQ